MYTEALVENFGFDSGKIQFQSPHNRYYADHVKRSFQTARGNQVEFQTN